MGVNGNSAAEVVKVSVPELSTNDLLGTRPIMAALYVLQRAKSYARDARGDHWQFAIERHVLNELGITNSDLRWLLWKEFVQHAEETTGAQDKSRNFSPRGSSVLDDRSCFVLTQQGEQVAATTLGNGNGNGNGNGAVLEFPGLAPTHLSASLMHVPMRPKWDCELREVRYGGELVKQYKVPSPNQELVLTAFEEENWPRRIDDPLPPLADMNAKQRLHDTIRSLNRNQRNHRLRFMGDGTGEGVVWEPFASQSL